MKQQLFDGILITRPTRDDIESLSVGDLAPTVFGDMRKVTRIFASGMDTRGKVYVCYYTENEGFSISGSMTEGEPVATIPAGSEYNTTDRYPKF